MPMVSPFNRNMVWQNVNGTITTIAATTATTATTSVTGPWITTSSTAATPATPTWYERVWPEWSVYDAPWNEEYINSAPRLTDQQLYEKAVAEHDQQEATRIRLRIVERAARALEIEERNRKDREDRDAAKERAKELLLSTLTPIQQETYRRNDWFIVEGGKSGTKYKIHGAHLTANIDVLDRHGGKTHRLCGHAPAMHQIPIADNLLAQKLMLECDEDAFLRIANRHS